MILKVYDIFIDISVYDVYDKINVTIFSMDFKIHTLIRGIGILDCN